MDEVITMAHGSGGEKYRELVENVFLPAYKNKYIAPLTDSAVLEGASQIAMTTDSYVVKPIFFSGGNIGSLAVSGTVNDLSVSGSIPKYLSVGMIIKAGFPIELLKKIVNSIAETAYEAGVSVVTGDTKVTENNENDNSIYINTAGVGIFTANRPPLLQKISDGDKIIITGNIAAHGMAVMCERENIEFSPKILSDAAPLSNLTHDVLSSGCKVNAMRDPTRGGVAATLCEWVSENTDIVVYNDKIPISTDVSSACEILGMDPLYIANEGIILLSVPEKYSSDVLSVLKNTKHGKNSAIIGEVSKGSGVVKLKTEYGSYRRIIMPSGDLLPRIC